MFDSVGGGEIMLILIAILVLFGPKRIPDLAQSLGKGLREFRRAQQELQNNLSSVVNDDEFKNLSKSFNDIKQDMHSSMQKLTGEFHASVQPLNDVLQTPALPSLPAPASELPPALPVADASPVPPPDESAHPTGPVASSPSATNPPPTLS